MIWTIPRFAHQCGTVIPVLLPISLNACGVIGPSTAASAQSHPSTLEGNSTGVLADTSLLAAVLQSIPAPRAQRRIRVDPHPFRPDPSLISVRVGDFLPVNEDVVRERAAVLERLGIERLEKFDSATTRRCETGPGGLSPRREAGEPLPPVLAERVLCVLVAAPRSAERPDSSGRSDVDLPPFDGHGVYAALG
jgi:hypothetical protein